MHVPDLSYLHSSQPGKAEWRISVTHLKVIRIWIYVFYTKGTPAFHYSHFLLTSKFLLVPYSGDPMKWTGSLSPFCWRRALHKYIIWGFLSLSTFYSRMLSLGQWIFTGLFPFYEDVRSRTQVTYFLVFPSPNPITEYLLKLQTPGCKWRRQDEHKWKATALCLYSVPAPLPFIGEDEEYTVIELEGPAWTSEMLILRDAL